MAILPLSSEDLIKTFVDSWLGLFSASSAAIWFDGKSFVERTSVRYEQQEYMSHQTLRTEVRPTVSIKPKLPEH